MYIRLPPIDGLVCRLILALIYGSVSEKPLKNPYARIHTDSAPSDAGLAELADAMALGAIGRKAVGVQIPYPAPVAAES